METFPVNELKNSIARTPATIEVEVPLYRCARTHKKKRIDKKWLKRYGYILSYRRITAKVLEMKADDFPSRFGSTSFEIDF